MEINKYVLTAILKTIGLENIQSIFTPDYETIVVKTNGSLGYEFIEFVSKEYIDSLEPEELEDTHIIKQWKDFVLLPYYVR